MEFRPINIKQLRDYYEISTTGVVRKKNGVIRTQRRISPGGYPIMAFFAKKNRKAFFIHRMIALTFIPNPDNKPQVNHKDGNKLNFDINNLEWATASENCLHSVNVLGNKNHSTTCFQKGNKIRRKFPKKHCL